MLFFSIGQRSTMVKRGPAGEIVISQWATNVDDDNDRVEFDPIFVPTLIKWLQELTAPEAVG